MKLSLWGAAFSVGVFVCAACDSDVTYSPEDQRAAIASVEGTWETDGFRIRICEAHEDLSCFSACQIHRHDAQAVVCEPSDPASGCSLCQPTAHVMASLHFDFSGGFSDVEMDGMVSFGSVRPDTLNMPRTMDHLVTDASGPLLIFATADEFEAVIDHDTMAITIHRFVDGAVIFEESSPFRFLGDGGFPSPHSDGMDAGSSGTDAGMSMEPSVPTTFTLRRVGSGSCS